MTLKEFTYEEVEKVDCSSLCRHRTPLNLSLSITRKATSSVQFHMFSYPTHSLPLRPQWIVIDSKVYDVSKFANLHPGGLAVLLADGVGVFTSIITIESKALSAVPGIPSWEGFDERILRSS